MALPIAKVAPSHSITIPSTGQNVNMRPYLVSEEKVLLIAFESQNNKQIMAAIVDVIEACLKEDIKVSKLAIFDLEYMFMQLRAVSVGETVEGKFKCSKCEAFTNVDIDLGGISVELPDDPKPPLLEIQDGIKIQLKYPTIDDIRNNAKITGKDHVAARYETLLVCIDKVVTDDEEHKFSDSSRKEREEFVGAFSGIQFEPMWKFVEGIPQASVEISFECSGCGHTNEFSAKGIHQLFN